MVPHLCALLGCGLGYLYFSKQPAQYEASALVRVVDSLPQSSRAVQAFDPDEIASYSRTDESIVIKSQKVLRMAVEHGQLTQLPSLQGMSSEQIVGMLSGSDLVVQPADKDVNTSLLSISYVCHDAELAAAVVNAVVAGYSDYLSEEYRTVGNEVYELLSTAQDKLEDHFKTIHERNAEFRASTPDVIWSGSEATDPYYAIFLQVKAELSELQMEREKLHANLVHVQQGIAANRPAAQLLLMLAHSDNEKELIDALFGNEDLDAQPSIETKVESEAARMERTDLFALEMRHKELLDTAGDGHPAVTSARRRIELMREQIARLAASERQEELQTQRLQQAASEAAEKNGLTNGISVEERLAVRVNALQEREASLEIQIDALQKMSDEYLAQSQKLQGVIIENKARNKELDSISMLLEPYTEKVKAIELLPQAGQRSLKELNLPTIGGFYGPKLSPYLLGGSALGFLVLSGLAVLMDLADRSYRSPDEITADLGVPVLGHIPAMDVSKIKKIVDCIDASVTTVHHSRGRVSEAYRSVRTGLFFSNRGSELKLIQVTSPVPGDGKSTLSSNLAVTMAQSGRRVLLIDADFRRPRIAKIFGIDADVGMAQVVACQAEIEDATFASSVANLSIMPGGKRPSNPAELLSTHRFQALLEMLREKYDVVIVDTPPVLAVTDPCAVSAMVDGVVMTMRLRRNVKPLVTRAMKILDSVDARLLGVVVNGVSSEAGYGYSYGYNDYRYAYRSGGSYRYGSAYGGYSAGYIEDKQEANASLQSVSNRDIEQAGR